MLWGGDFHRGYVWILPEGGYEYVCFGRNDRSIHCTGRGPKFGGLVLWRSEPARRLLPDLCERS